MSAKRKNEKKPKVMLRVACYLLLITLICLLGVGSDKSKQVKLLREFREKQNYHKSVVISTCNEGLNEDTTFSIDIEQCKKAVLEAEGLGIYSRVANSNAGDSSSRSAQRAVEFNGNNSTIIDDIKETRRRRAERDIFPACNSLEKALSDHCANVKANYGNAFVYIQCISNSGVRYGYVRPASEVNGNTWNHSIMSLSVMVSQCYI